MRHAIAAALVGTLAGAPAAASATTVSFNEYTFRTARSGPSIVMVDHDDTVYVAMARAGKIGRLRDGEIREYDLPPDSFPVGIALHPDGRVWYSDIRRNVIGRLDPRTGALEDFPVPTEGSWPFFVAVHPDGTLWFTERMGNKVGRLDPRTGKVVEYPVPTPRAQPAGLAITPDGQVFFTENSGNHVGQIDPSTGRLVEHRIPTPTAKSPFYGLAGIAADARGDVWFAVVDGRLARLRRDVGAIEEIDVPDPESRPAGVVVDRWGIVWFTELDGNRISSYDPVLRAFRRYLIPTGAPDPRPMGPPETTARGQMPIPGNRARTSRPFGIAADSRGRIWFSQQYAHKLAVLEAPPIEIVAPAGPVGGAAAPVAVRTRLPGPASLDVRIDGQTGPASGALDLTALAPGPHTLTAVARGQDLPYAEARATFTVNPTLETIEALLARATAEGQLDGPLTESLRADLLVARESERTGRGPTAREAVRGMIGALDGRPLGDAGRRLLEHLRYLDRFGRRTYVVELTERPPVRTPEHVQIEAGDAVRFVNHRRDGVRLAARDGSFVSPVIRPGGSWDREFAREGTVEYVLGTSPESRATIAVGPRTTFMRHVALPGPGRVPGVLSVDAHDRVWFTAGGGQFLTFDQVPVGDRIGVVDREGRVTEYETPTPGSGPTSIVAARSGRVFFTERIGNRIGELDPATGVIREHPVPTAEAGLTGIAEGPDGRVWFTEKAKSRIGVLEPSTGRIREIDTPTPASEPSTVVVDPAGRVWFDERAADAIVRLDPETGAMREFPVPTKGSRVVGLTPDPRGYVWFLELGAHKVGRLDVATGHVVEYAIPTRMASPFKMALDRAGRVWFTEVFGNRIGVLEGERVQEFALPKPKSLPGGIAIDSKGNVWFTEQAGDRLGMIPGGAVDAPVADAVADGRVASSPSIRYTAASE